MLGGAAPGQAGARAAGAGAGGRGEVNKDAFGPAEPGAGRGEVPRRGEGAGQL